MSSPPAYDANPDKRPLPAGWITQYDPNYNAWFYVNTEVTPPVTTWNHPSGPTPPPERKTYSPPTVSANNNSSTYAGGYSPATGQGGYPSQGGGNSYPQPPFGGYGNSGGAEYERDYPQQNVDNHNQRGIGGLLGRLTGGGRPGNQNDNRFGHEGRFGGSGGGYPGQQQQPQVVYVQQQQQPRKGGFGMGGMALAGGAGLLGGVLLADALDGDDRNCDYDDGGFDGGDGGFGDDGGDFF